MKKAVVIVSIIIIIFLVSLHFKLNKNNLSFLNKKFEIADQNDNNTEEELNNDLENNVDIEELNNDEDKEELNNDEEDEISENKIDIYLFWGNGCLFCEKEKSFFQKISNKYGRYYNFHSYEVWFNE